MNKKTYSFLLVMIGTAVIVGLMVMVNHMIIDEVDDHLSFSSPQMDREESIRIATDLIKNYEKLRLDAYPDGGGCSVGWGHHGVSCDTVWAESEANAWLIKDVDFAAKAVDELVTVDLSVGQRAALIDFVYNFDRWRFGSSTMLEKLNAGDYDAVPVELQRWVYGEDIDGDGKKDIMAGLVSRREAEIALWVQ